MKRLWVFFDGKKTAIGAVVLGLSLPFMFFDATEELSERLWMIGGAILGIGAIHKGVKFNQRRKLNGGAQ